jgi:hypothetical protein
MPILLKIVKKRSKSSFLMKFNQAWLMEEYYKRIVGSTWNPLVEDDGNSFMKQFSDNLFKIKKFPKSWAKASILKAQSLIRDVELRLDIIGRKVGGISFRG